MSSLHLPFLTMELECFLSVYKVSIPPHIGLINSTSDIVTVFAYEEVLRTCPKAKQNAVCGISWQKSMLHGPNVDKSFYHIMKF